MFTSKCLVVGCFVLAVVAVANAASPDDITHDDLDMDVHHKPRKCPMKVDVGDKVAFWLKGKYSDPINGELFLFETDFKPDNEAQGYKTAKINHHFVTIRLYNETHGLFPALEHALLGSCVWEQRQFSVPAEYGFGKKGYKAKLDRPPCNPNPEQRNFTACRDVPPNSDLEIEIEVFNITKAAELERHIRQDKIIADYKAKRLDMLEKFDGSHDPVTSFSPQSIVAGEWGRLDFVSTGMLADEGDLSAFIPVNEDCATSAVESFQGVSGDYLSSTFYAKYILEAGEYKLCYKVANADKSNQLDGGTKWVEAARGQTLDVQAAKTDL